MNNDLEVAMNNDLEVAHSRSGSSSTIPSGVGI